MLWPNRGHAGHDVQSSRYKRLRAPATICTLSPDLGADIKPVVQQAGAALGVAVNHRRSPVPTGRGRACARGSTA